MSVVTSVEMKFKSLFPTEDVFHKEVENSLKDFLGLDNHSINEKTFTWVAKLFKSLVVSGAWDVSNKPLWLKYKNLLDRNPNVDITSIDFWKNGESIEDAATCNKIYSEIVSFMIFWSVIATVTEDGDDLLKLQSEKMYETFSEAFCDRFVLEKMFA